ncbi:MAG: helix-turn-helix transcriptional regulator [Selenomonadaceae bacterium]|nr:helix-turn-helix transcriptional regulator [Selenomonadaceae bacterium]
MPKTKNAFALQKFDTTRILQRIWFKDFDLPVDDDEIFLNAFGKTIEGITTVKNLEIITRLGDRTVFYEALLERHITRLNELQRYYVEKFMPTEERDYREKLERVIELVKFYREALSSIASLRDKILLKIQTLKEFFEKDFRQRFFGSRLRQARKAMGLSQQELAERVGFKTFNSIAQYERGIRDPSLPTLFRLATELKCSADWLLNLQK